MNSIRSPVMQKQELKFDKWEFLLYVVAQFIGQGWPDKSGNYNSGGKII